MCLFLGSFPSLCLICPIPMCKFLCFNKTINRVDANEGEGGEVVGGVEKRSITRMYYIRENVLQMKGKKNIKAKNRQIDICQIKKY